jgi:glycosyltransferase involved in cell wall biosynthesis
MKILWVNANFLHPTTKGGQIRTLEMLRQLHLRHEIHYVAFDDPEHPEGIQRATEYSTRAYPVTHRVPPRRSVAFAMQALASLLSPLPLSVTRYRSADMAQRIRELRQAHAFDAIVCDFLFPAPNFHALEECVLFEHNVESTIWQRHAATAGNPLLRAYFGLQARRMLAYEGEVCRKVAQVIAVSPLDADVLRKLFDIQHVDDVPTGVDLEHFSPPAPAPPTADLVFSGSMDWLPNIDGVDYFIAEIFPLILEKRPQCSLIIAGRRPVPRLQKLAEQFPNITVTGTVPDIRPFLWQSAISIVPLRIGSGTRLKIYESMAAKVPVVSTTIGAEGLEINPPNDIRIADSPREFAVQCLDLLENTPARAQVADAGYELVSTRFSWEQVTRKMEDLLISTPSAASSSSRNTDRKTPPR